MIILKAILVIIGAYLIGGISSSLLIGRWGYSVDIREHGSGNLGATNAYRVLGPFPAVIILLADFLKGILAVLLAKAFFESEPTLLANSVIALAGLAAIVGHTWSIYIKFSGGKGVATGAGVLVAMLGWKVVGVLLVIWLVVAVVSRYVSAASVTIAAAAPFVTYYFHPGNWPFLIFSVVAGGTVIYNHRSNIRRLLSGRELKFGQRSSGERK